MRVFALLLALAAFASAARHTANSTYTVPPDITPPTGGALEPWLKRYTADSNDIRRIYDAPWSAHRRQALRTFHKAWLDALARALDLEERCPAVPRPQSRGEDDAPPVP